MNVFTEIMTDVSQAVNEVFGELCALYIKDPYQERADVSLPSINVILDTSNEVKGEFNNIVGYRTAVKILRSDLDIPPRGDECYIQTLDGDVYHIGEMIKSNLTAFWLVASLTSDVFPSLPVGDDISIGELYINVELFNNLELHT